MHHRHAKWLTTLAAGWYLIRPPISWNDVVMKDVPLNHWQQVASFDTAATCEKRRDEIAHQQEPAVIPPGHDPVPGTVWVEQANLSQCVSADDTRLSPTQPPRPYMPVYP
jgi:hypothetical protein